MLSSQKTHHILERSALLPLPYFLSGGLSHETVHEALEVLSGNPPMAIDVSSKIEESIGIKDFDKLSLFMEAVQSTT